MVTTTTNTHNTTTYPCAMFVGDFNGDGRDDLIIHWSANYKRQLLVYPGSADGKFGSSDGTNAAPVNTNTNDNSDTSVYPCSLHVGDFNGDEKTDFLVHYNTLSGKRANYVFCGQAGATFASGIGTTFTEAYDGEAPVFVGDITGDDKDDVIVQWVSGGTRRLITYRAALSGNATFGTGVHVNTNQSVTDGIKTNTMLGDIDGDFDTDYVVEYASLDTAYRSVVCINLGYSQGLYTNTLKYNLRTFYYIAY